MWKKGDRYHEKVLCEKTSEEIYSMVKQQIYIIHEHCYRKCVQGATYQKQIAELCEGEVVIHVDYSENFKNKQQNEMTAGYYGLGQFSLFTIDIYIKEGDNVVCKNYALVTPENDHSCNISLGLNNFMISQICSDYNIYAA